MHIKYHPLQLAFLLALRMVIGWHFLYEGLVKWLMPNWSAASYLEMSNWIFAGFFHWIASNSAVLAIVDAINIWGLMIIGIALILGMFVKSATIAGLVLLALYYVANPPLVGLDFGVPTEGHYLVINKIAVEFMAMGVLLVFPTSQLFGVDLLINKSRTTKSKSLPEHTKTEPTGYGEPPNQGRRAWLRGLATLPVMGLFGYAFARKQKWQSWEEQNLVDAMTRASAKTVDLVSLKELKGKLSNGKIKGVEFSRLILGGNLLSGWAHSRDLMYVSQLVKAYHHKDKIFGTLLLAEKCGINTLLSNPILCSIISEYWKRQIGKIQFISDCAGLDYTAEGASAAPFKEFLVRIQKAIDHGAIACYIQGETADYYIENNKVDAIARALDYIRSQGVITGIGAHRIETIKACVIAGLNPDFWMKTMHHHNYWSAKNPTWHDNMYCFKPEETIRYMEALPQPWIAFKVMAAGSIKPEDGFRYAFESGADFVCAGMYDFQMVKDTNIALDILNTPMKRKREWRA